MEKRECVISACKVANTPSGVVLCDCNSFSIILLGSGESLHTKLTRFMAVPSSFTGIFYAYSTKEVVYNTFFYFLLKKELCTVRSIYRFEFLGPKRQFSNTT